MYAVGTNLVGCLPDSEPDVADDWGTAVDLLIEEIMHDWNRELFEVDPLDGMRSLADIASDYVPALRSIATLRVGEDVVIGDRAYWVYFQENE